MSLIIIIKESLGNKQATLPIGQKLIFFNQSQKRRKIFINQENEFEGEKAGFIKKLAEFFKIEFR